MQENLLGKYNEAVEDVINSEAALKWALSYLPVKCPEIDMKIYCAETKCSPDCPIYAKESGYLAYSVAQM